MSTENESEKEETKALSQDAVSGSFDDDAYLEFYIENQPILTKEDEEAQMIRINKGCDLIRQMGLTANIPEPH